jgi:hypothetical protein
MQFEFDDGHIHARRRSSQPNSVLPNTWDEPALPSAKSKNNRPVYCHFQWQQPYNLGPGNGNSGMGRPFNGDLPTCAAGVLNGRICSKREGPVRNLVVRLAAVGMALVLCGPTFAAPKGWPALKLGHIATVSATPLSNFVAPPGDAAINHRPTLAQDQCIADGQTCTLNGTPCCGTEKCKGTFPNTTCQP